MADINAEVTALKNQVASLKLEVGRLTSVLRNVTGSPIITGYAGRQLVLNDSINVIDLLKRISDLETQLDSHLSGG